MKLLVCGHSRHGKDTLCEILRDDFGLSFTGSSWFMRKHVWMWLDNEGVRYPSPEDAYGDRHNYREVWHDAIESFNTPEKDRLAKAILEESDVYCGMRNAVEFRVSRRHFDLAIWVDASEREPAEPGESNSVTAQMCDVTIDNNGSEADLRTRVLTLFSRFWGMNQRVRLKERIYAPYKSWMEPGTALWMDCQPIVTTCGTLTHRLHDGETTVIPYARPEWLDLV